MGKFISGKTSILALTATFAIITILLGKTLTFSAFATESIPAPDSCNEVFTYEKGSDFENSKVNINIVDFEGDHDRRLVVSPKSGYQLTFIGVDYAGSDDNEATPSVEDGFVTITYDAPDDENIDNTTISLKQVCSTPTPTPTATPNDPSDLCPNVAGVQTSIPEGWYRLDGPSFECRQFQYGGPGDGGNGGSVQGTGTGGQVLGASTMAGTGSFDETVYQAIMSIGATLSAIGVKGLKKAKKVSKK